MTTREGECSDAPVVSRSAGVATVWYTLNRYAVLDKNQQVRQRMKEISLVQLDDVKITNC